MKKIQNFLFCVSLIIAVSAVWGCSKTDLEQEYDNQKEMRKFLKDKYMKTFYYWNNSMPDIPVSTNVDIYKFFNMNLVKEDRWSWMMDAESYLNSESGVVTGTYGASITQPIEYYDDYSVIVRYVYPGSPFANEGVTRGWTLTHIEGTKVMDLIYAGTFSKKYYTSPQTFTFTDTEGQSHTFTTTAANQLNTRSALMTKIFTGEDYPGLTESVGYFNYLSFKAEADAYGKPMIDDIHEAMELFRENGVKKVILDLRYNGGGDSRASDTLVGYLAPASADGKTYVKRSHNSSIAKDYDEESQVKRIPDKSLDLDALYVITGEGSASASEMVLNGLEPLMEVHHVGDTTYGKPNGMYVLTYPYKKKGYNTVEDYKDLEYVFLPICFYNVNGNDRKIPDTGMIPDIYIPDDIYHDFGAKERNIAACLNHIVKGKYQSDAEIQSLSKMMALPGVKISLTEEEIDPFYGKYLVKP